MSDFNAPSESESFRVQEEAVTFDESGITFSNNLTVSGGGDISLGAKTGTTATRPSDGSSESRSLGRGIVIEPQTDIFGVDVTVSVNSSGFNEIALVDTNENIIDSEINNSLFSGGDTVRLKGLLSANTSYHITAYNGGNSYTAGLLSSPSYPHTSTDVDITATSNFAHPEDGSALSTRSNNARMFSSVTALSSKVLSGDCEVDFTEKDLEAYDAVTYQVEEPSSGSDTSSVTCDVIDANDNVVLSDIPENENTDISEDFSASQNPRLRFNIARDVTSLEPAVTYAAESYFR